jgi:hypothetical protein
LQKKNKLTISFSDGIIANFSRQYIDTRTQANLAKLKINKNQEVNIVTEEMSNILERRRNSGKLSHVSKMFILTLLIICWRTTFSRTF